MIVGRDTPWEAMLGEDERETTEEEVAALEAAHGPFLPADGEGRSCLHPEATPRLYDCGPDCAL